MCTPVSRVELQGYGFKLEFLNAGGRVLVVLSSLDSSFLSVEASPRHLLTKGLTRLQLSEHFNIEPAPPGSLFLGESDPTELDKEQVSETLRTYRPRSRLLADSEKAERGDSKEKSGGKKTPKGAPPPPKIGRRISLPPPPSPNIPLRPPPPAPRKCTR